MLRATQTGKMACTPSENDLPPDVAAVIDDDALADLQNGPTSPEPGSAATDRQLPLLGDAPVSVVPYPQLVKLAETAIRVESRKVYAFDWHALVADRPEWRLTEAVHRKAVQQARKDGLDVQPSDVPTDTVLTAVQSVIALWTRQPELRPTEEGYAQEQVRRGQIGGQNLWAKTADNRARRDASILALAAEGVSPPDIHRRLGASRTTVWRVLNNAKASETPPAALPTAPPPFPAPELPTAERWPVTRLMAAGDVELDASEAIWIADWGKCYEAEGRESEYLRQVEASAGADVDPVAYLQRCIRNGDDAWRVTPQLLADVLTWCGKASLEKALTNIGGGYVDRPLPYLRRSLVNGVGQGRRSDCSMARPVAVAVHLAQRWAPELEVTDAAAAIAAEEAAHRTGYIDDYRRRHGRLPWEGPPEQPCFKSLGVNGADDVSTPELRSSESESSPGNPKALETPEPEKVEHAPNPAKWPDSLAAVADRRPGAAQKSAQRPRSASGGAGGEPDLEHGQAGDGLGRDAPD